MRLVEGTYELMLGDAAGERARIIASSGFEYEMTAPAAWHAVRAIGAPAMTIMVTGPRWNRSAVPVADDTTISPLSDDEIAAMLDFYRQRLVKLA
jgi:hypothetical protein